MLTIPGYTVRKELGRGGMGVVYLAHNTLMARPEVIKVITSQAANADRFRREIQATGQLNHPNVVTAYAALPIDGGIALAMEYVDGTDLDKLVRADGPLSVVRACNYVAQAANGLQHALDRGLCHRDIKPSNLMVTKVKGRAVVKVLDFGLAKVRGGAADDQLTGHGQMMGTPAFLAPEQARDAAAADTRADVYSLGCTLFFLLTGRPPFRGSLTEVLLAHQAEPSPPMPGVPPELSAVVAKMMAKAPADRYPTPEAVTRAVRPFARPGKRSGEVVSAEATTLINVSPKSSLFESSNTETNPAVDKGSPALESPREAGEGRSSNRVLAKDVSQRKKSVHVNAHPSPSDEENSSRPQQKRKGKNKTSRVRSIFIFCAMAFICCIGGISWWLIQCSGESRGFGTKQSRIDKASVGAIPFGWKKFEDPMGEIEIYFPTEAPKKDEFLSAVLTKETSKPADVWSRQTDDITYTLKRMTVSDSDMRGKTHEAAITEVGDGLRGVSPPLKNLRLSKVTQNGRSALTCDYDVSLDDRRVISTIMLIGNHLIFAEVKGKSTIRREDMEIAPFFEHVRLLK